MSVKIRVIEMDEDEHFIVRLAGNAESSLAIRALKSGIQISGPANNHKSDLIFSLDGVRDAKELERVARIMDDL